MIFEAMLSALIVTGGIVIILILILIDCYFGFSKTSDEPEQPLESHISYPSDTQYESYFLPISQYPPAPPFASLKAVKSPAVIAWDTQALSTTSRPDTKFCTFTRRPLHSTRHNGFASLKAVKSPAVIAWDTQALSSSSPDTKLHTITRQPLLSTLYNGSKDNLTDDCKLLEEKKGKVPSVHRRRDPAVYTVYSSLSRHPLLAQEHEDEAGTPGARPDLSPADGSTSGS